MLCLAMLIAGSAMAEPPAAVGLIPRVTFSQYSDLSSTPELVRRMTTPLTAWRAARQAAGQGRRFAGQPVDVSQEHFLLFVPPGTPRRTEGHALLVFVPPWPNAQLPREWLGPLERHDVIFVSADNSGNEANPLDRRVPLALLAYENVRRQYPVDAGRVFIGGFSGGSRIALRMLVGYADVFRGALLNAGSDPLGGRDVPLPAADALQDLQRNARLIYVTGENDGPHLIDDMQSRRSLDRWCIFNAVTLSEPRRAHEPADASAMSRALEELLGPPPPPDRHLSACRDRLQSEQNAALDRVESAFSRGDTSAPRLLEKLDLDYGGLVAPRSVELAGR
jgi:hypothetical protein